MARTRLLLVGGLVVLAGCLAVAVPQAADVGERFDRPSSGGDDARTVSADEQLAPAVSVTPGGTFDRLTSLLGVEADRPRVVVRDLDDDHRYEPEGFYRTMGLDERPDADLNVSAFYEDGQVTIDPGTASPALVEQVLAHEFVHALQAQGTLAGAEAAGAMADASTTDENVALRGAVEGEAVWITHHYAERHVPEATRTAAVRSQAWQQGPPAAARVAAPYHFGQRYVDSQVDDPAALGRIAVDPPTTTEQLVHNHTPAAEPPAQLSLSVDADPHAVVESDVQGELATRVVLRAGVDRPSAREAATGWATDRLQQVRVDGAGETFGYVWAHRWDTAGDARTFVAATERFAANRTGDDPGTVRVVRASDETTAVFAGPSGFVANATADGTAGSVAVSLEPSD